MTKPRRAHHDIHTDEDEFDATMAKLLGILEESFDDDTPPSGRGSAAFFYLFGMKVMLGFLSATLRAEHSEVILRYHAQIEALRVSNEARYKPDVTGGGPPLNERH